MRKMILIVLLIISILEINGATFGDIYAFPSTCCKITYKHYGIYVGNKTFGKDSNGDLFHRHGLTGKWGCGFGNLTNMGTHEIDNYLDKYLGKFPQFKVGTPEEITARINEKSENCKLYGLLNNNCEHLATYVRYGVSISLQTGQDGEKYCINNDIDADTLKEIRKVLKDAEPETGCDKCPV
ncbi:hypothetical protein PAMA_015628 [Pampus argenteus]